MNIGQKHISNGIQLCKELRLVDSDRRVTEKNAWFVAAEDSDIGSAMSDYIGSMSDDAIRVATERMDFLNEI